MSKIPLNQIEKDEFPEGWENRTLGSLGKVITGKTPPTVDADNFGVGYPFITPRDMDGQKYVRSTERYLTNKGKDIVKNCLLPSDSVCVSCIGSDMGKVVMTDRPSITNQQLNSLVCEEADPQFVYYAVANISDALRNAAFHSTAVPILNKSQFASFKILIPKDIAEQRSISEILFNLDAMIELNHQMKKTLEAMAQVLFRRWFVDFEFPGYEKTEFVDGLPEGWRKGNLEEIIKNFDSKRIPLSSQERNLRKGEYPYYGAASLMDYVDDYIFEGVYILMGEDGTVVTDKGYPVLQYVWDKFWVNNHAHVMQGKEGMPTEYVLLQLQQTNIQHIVTGAVQPKINQGNMNKLPVIIPDSKIMKRFSEAICPIYDKFRCNSDEIKNLSQIRDFLLPKLMSGSVRV